MIKKYYKFFRHELIFFVFFILLIFLSLKYSQNIKNYPFYIHWDTIKTLAGLLIITTAIKESGYIEKFAISILKKIKTERNLALFLVSLSVILSTFLTNDISLFIVIPLSISLYQFIKGDVIKLIIFEAIAVNIGSALTPIGNPQNIFLYHVWKISFLKFIAQLFPLFLFQLILLLLLTFFVFKKKSLNFKNENIEFSLNKRLIILSIFLFFLFIFSIEYRFINSILIIIVILNFKILKKVDWMLIILFIVIFIDFTAIAKIKSVTNFVYTLNLTNFNNITIFSALISQIISNVPAAVFLSKFCNNYKAIAYGVNIGGNGLFIGSLANIIALRMANNRKIWIDFHKYSIPFFLLILTCFILI